jgi:hypothetical protein
MLKRAEQENQIVTLDLSQGCISGKFAKAADLRGEIAEIYSFTKHFIGLAEGRNYLSQPDAEKSPAPIPVHPARISILVDRAEKVGLVNREGMELSGLAFICQEQKYLSHGEVPTAAIVPTVMQIHREARRAMNILDNEEGYIPRRNRLYGPYIKWTPLIP